MFCRGAIEVLFNLKAAEVEIAEEGETMPIKLILFLRSFGTWDLWSDLGSHWTPI